MRRLLLLAPLLVGCAASFDSNEYLILAQMDQATVRAEKLCGSDVPGAMRTLPDLRQQADLLRIYAAPLPYSQNIARIGATLAAMAEAPAGDHSPTYCIDKFHMLHRSIDRTMRLMANQQGE